MPIYAFACKCGHTTEEIQSFDAPPPEHCGEPMTRQPSAVSFAYRTRGGNTYGFSGAHGAVTKGSRRPATISRGHGLGGHRAPPSIRTGVDGKVAVEAK